MPISCPIIELKSSSHARSLALFTIRILLQATTTSLFLQEYRPVVIDLLTSTWPAPGSFRSNETQQVPSRKGKERADVEEEFGEVQKVFLAEWLDSASIALSQSVGGFGEREIQLIGQRVLEVVEARLSSDEPEKQPDAMEVDSDVETDKADRRKFLRLRIDSNLLELVFKIQGDASISNRPDVRQLFCRLVASEGESLVSVLFDETRSDPIRSCSLLILAYPLSSIRTNDSILPIANSSSSSSGSPLDLLSIASLRKLDQSLQKHAECPVAYPIPQIATALKSTYSLLLSDHDNRNSIISERAAIEAQNSNTTAVARKRRRLEGNEAPSSDGIMEIDEGPMSTARRREKRKGPAKDTASKMLEQLVTRATKRGDGTLKEVLEQGEKFEAFDSKISRIIS